MDAVFVRSATVKPASYARYDLKAFDAVTVFDGFGYVTVNFPQAAYFSSTGNLTVQRSRVSGSDKTVTTKSQNAFIATVVVDGHTFDFSDGSTNDLRMLRKFLTSVYP